MLISTATGYPARQMGIEPAVRLLCEAGYDRLDLTLHGEANYFECDNRNEILRNLKDITSSYGVSFNQAHAPFGGGYDKYTTELVPKMPAVFDFCGELGIDTVVVHPLQQGRYYGNEERLFDMNMEFYSKLAPYAKNAGVRICIENMWQYHPIAKYIVDDVCAPPEELARYYDTLNDPSVFTVCLDLGHVALCGREPEDAIRIIGHDRLGALHVHDVDYKSDLHTLPGVGKIKWDNVCRALADVDYKGIFTYEANAFFAGYDVEYYPVVAKFMVDTARYLTAKIEKYKAEK